MAIERDAVEIPLFVGMGEGKDAQSRTDSAVVSENVRFLKTGSVKTRPAFAVKASGISGEYASVIPTKTRALIATTESIVAIDATEEARLLSGYSGARQMDEVYVSPNNDSAAWVRAFRVDTELVVFWLSPTRSSSISTSSYLDLWATVVSFGGEVVSPPEILRQGVGMSYDAKQADDGTIGVVTTDLANNVYVDVFSYAGGTVATDHTATFTASSLFTSPEVIKRVALTKDGTGWVVGVVTGYTGSTIGVDYRGQTGFWRITSALVFSASTVVDTGTSSLNHLGGGALLAMSTSPAGVLWIASGDYHDSRPYVYTFPAGSFVASTPLAIDGPYSWPVSHPAASPSSNGLYNGHVTLAGNAVVSDGGFAFDGESPFFAWHGVARMDTIVQNRGSSEPSPTASGVSTQHCLWGTHVVYLTDVATVSSTYSFPQCTLGSIPWIEGDDCVVPLIAEEGWSVRNDTPGVGLPVGDKFILPVEPEEDAYEQYSIFNQTTEARPSYAHAGLGRLTQYGDARIDTVFGMDEAVRHSEIAHEFIVPNPSPAPPYHNANYVLCVGSPVDLGNGSTAFVHPRRTVYQAAPFDGNGVAAGKYRVGFGCFICVSVVGDPVQAGGADTADLPVLSVGVPALVDSDTVIAYTPPLPPQVVAYRALVGTGAVTTTREFKFCWCWVDSRGIRHRGPVSSATSIDFTNFDVVVDLGWIPVTPPPPIPGLLSDKLLLEVYANPIDSTATVTPDEFVLIHTRSLPTSNIGAPFYVPVSLVSTDGVILPLLYTTGGVLPNEACPVYGPVVTAKRRIWAFSGTRVYYSKETQYRDPGGFNANLYLDSPDGGEITGITSIDEQVICFTQRGIFVVRGNGPNGLGAGGAFTSQQLQTQTGCVDRNSVVTTEHGAFFRGHRGIYLLQRNMSVTYFGEPEDSLPDEDMKSAFFDRETFELYFLFDSVSLVLDTASGLWTKVDTPANITSGAWALSTGPLLAGGGFVWSIDPVRPAADDIYDRDSFLPMRHSTPWLELHTKQGYQRCRDILVQGHATINPAWVPADDTDPQNVIPGYYASESDAFLTVKVFVDHEAEPSDVRVIDLRTEELDPLELRVPVTRQKCRSVRVELLTTNSSLDLTVTSVTALIGRKKGADKRQTTQGT